MEISIKQFEELSNRELYQILKLRFDVFIIEQRCVYPEYDDIDYDAIHFFMVDNNEVSAYLRVYQKADDVMGIGRVVISQSQRKKGLGQVIMQKAIDYIKNNLEAKQIKISAQLYIQMFYESLGFKQVSDVYDDAGIDHIDMILDL